MGPSRYTWVRAMPLAVLALQPGRLCLAQEQPVAGWFIAVEARSGDPLQDVPISIASGDAAHVVGRTDADGRATVFFSEIDADDGQPMDVEVLNLDGQVSIFLMPAGRRSNACMETATRDADTCTVYGDYLVSGIPSRYFVTTAGQTMIVERPFLAAIADDEEEDDRQRRSVQLEIGPQVGYNFGLEDSFFGVDFRAYLLELPYPFALDVMLSFYPMGAGSSAVAPAVFGSWMIEAIPNLETSIGLGLEAFRQSADPGDRGATAGTSMGIGIRFEARYELSRSIAPAIDAAVLRHDLGSEFRVTLGFRVRILGSFDDRTLW